MARSDWSDLRRVKKDLPRTHTGDPVTSHRAEAKARPRFNSHMELVLTVVETNPGLTASQISDHLASSLAFTHSYHARLFQVRRRLSDLKNRGLIERRRISNADQVSWFVKKEE